MTRTELDQAFTATLKAFPAASDFNFTVNKPPQIEVNGATMTIVVAIFGTTISPYLFFWQSSEEVEDQTAQDGPLLEHPEQAPEQLSRIRWDTMIGMAFSNVIAYVIILTTAVTLHASGKTDIQTSADAAEALRPVAGDFAFLLFALGIVGTGLLAIPVLAGSAAYAVAELFGWPSTLEAKFPEAVGFYIIILAATVIGFAMGFLPINPIRLLVWTAVINGIVAVPIMAMMMLVVTNEGAMGRFQARPSLKWTGWGATAPMGVTAGALFWSLVA